MSSDEASVSAAAPHFSMQQRLFHATHDIRSPTTKEFKEAWAFCNAVRSFIAPCPRVVIDVAGGHGALAALFLILNSRTEEAIVIDPAVADAGKRGIQQAWGQYIGLQKTLRYRHECLRTALPAELAGRDGMDVLVVACHACQACLRVCWMCVKGCLFGARMLHVCCTYADACCMHAACMLQHLTDEVLSIAAAFGCHVAVMPCCHKDHLGSWKAASKALGLPLGHGLRPTARPTA